MTINKIVLTRGLPASGKTTYALTWIAEDPENRVNVNRDDIRLSMFNLPFLDHNGEVLVTDVQIAAVKAAVSARKSVIVSDTNLRAATVKSWMKLAKQVGVDFEVVDIDTPLDECIKRNALREKNGERSVPEHVIRRMHSQYFVKGKLPPLPVIDPVAQSDRIYTPNPSLPPAYIFDVDGTTQLNLGGRGFYEWHRVHEDSPNESVIEVARRLHATGADIVVVSGRDAVCFDATLQNLITHGMPVQALFMRPQGSMEKDSIIKERILFDKIAPRWNVLGSFDDRNVVVQTWRRLGITTYQVNDGDF